MEKTAFEMTGKTKTYSKNDEDISTYGWVMKTVGKVMANMMEETTVKMERWSR